MFRYLILLYNLIILFEKKNFLKVDFFTEEIMFMRNFLFLKLKGQIKTETKKKIIS